jgi:hypothetical protein
VSEVKQWAQPAAVSLMLSCGSAAATARGPRMTIDMDQTPLMRAIRYAMALWIDEGACHDSVLLSDRFGCDSEVLERSLAQGRCGWTDLKPMFPDPLLNLRLETTLQETARLEGLFDISTLYGETVRILGWSAGLSGFERWARTLGMGLLGTRCFGVPTAEIVLVDIFTGARQTRILSSADLFDFEEQVLQLITNSGYRPGRHCEECPQVAYCPAHAEMVSSCLQTVISQRSACGEALDISDTAGLSAAANQVEATAAELRRRLATEGGSGIYI